MRLHATGTGRALKVGTGSPWCRNGHMMGTAQPAAPRGVQEGDAGQLSRVTVCFWLSHWLEGELWQPPVNSRCRRAPGAAVGKQGAASLGQWPSCGLAGTSSARLWPVLACAAPLHLAQANTTSRWALLVLVLLLRKLYHTIAYKASL